MVLHSSRIKRASTRDDGTTSAISWTVHPLSTMRHLTCRPLWKRSRKPSDECRKSPLERRIPAVIYKDAGPAALEAFHSVVTSIWEDKDMPQELRDTSIASLFKNKGSRADGGNYKGISLLSICGKILARIALNRLIAGISEANFPESRCGFRPGRSTIDMVFAVRQAREKCIEQNMHLAIFCLHRPRKSLWHRSTEQSPGQY